MTTHGTAIEWTHPPGYKGETWNPVTGCTKVSAGCKHCYAEGVAHRWWGDRKFTDVRCHEDRLEQPIRWRKPRCVFVNSMSDLFHEDVPDEFIARVFQEMRCAGKHYFLVLTKRPERMKAFLEGCSNAGNLGWITHNGTPPKSYGGNGLIVGTNKTWPLPNVGLGVSVENQATADARIPLLLRTPAAMRFVSYEPALGPVDFRADPEWLSGEMGYLKGGPKLDQIIVGGESGPGARPFNVEWARNTVRQCKAAGVACFVKQLGANVHETWLTNPKDFRSRKGGDPSEWPADIRVQQYPPQMMTRAEGVA